MASRTQEEGKLTLDDEALASRLIFFCCWRLALERGFFLINFFKQYIEHESDVSARGRNSGHPIQQPLI